MSVCINLIKLAILTNKKGFYINKNNKNLNLIKSLIKINIIKFIKINDKNIIVFINYQNNKPIFKNIVNMYKNNNKKIISLKNIIKINNKKNWLLLILTDIGILNNFEAEKKKKGGIVLMKIWN